MHEEKGVALFCDMHGHSRKQNIFVYGCNVKQQWEQSRILPYILSKISPLFDFSESRFNISHTKEATARVALFKEMHWECPQVYTLESTFSGIDKGPLSGQHISIQMLESMGKDFLRAFLLQQ